MLAYVEVTSDEVDFREGRNDNGYWSVRRQKAYLHQGAAYPLPFEVVLEDKQTPYPAGNYVLAGSSFRNGKFGLELGRSIKLVPLPEALSKIQELSRPGRASASTAAA